MNDNALHDQIDRLHDSDIRHPTKLADNQPLLSSIVLMTEFNSTCDSSGEPYCLFRFPVYTHFHAIFLTIIRKLYFIDISISTEASI
jgi:hypothetical protein